MSGVDLIEQIAAKCDIVIENFRPGKLEEWGLGYDVLSRDNAGLVMVRISGYGQTGPYRDRPGYGVTCEAVSGLRELTGDPDAPPSRVAVSLTDQIAALYGAFGAMLALFDRQRSGKGQVIDVALYEAAFSMTEPHVPAYSALGVVPTRRDTRLPRDRAEQPLPVPGRPIHPYHRHIVLAVPSLARRHEPLGTRPGPALCYERRQVA